MVDISKISDGTNTYDIKDSEARSELSNKQDTLVSGTNIKTINGTSVLGSGNITIEASSTPDVDNETISYNMNNALQTIAVKNKRDNSTLPIWHGTEQQWNQGVATTWYYWQTAMTALWTASTLPSSANWRSVTYGGGKFVAVAYGSDKSAYSTDGINWTASTLPSSVNWYSVTYGGGKFVAVAYGSDKPAYSTDGINWTASTLPSSSTWQSVTYGDGKFVAVAYSSDASAIFTMSYDKCYTLDSTPTTSSQVYSVPETTSTKTITSVGSGTITLSDALTYNYTSSGNQNTYRTIGDAHPDWLSNIDNVGVKIGNTVVATVGPDTSNMQTTTNLVTSVSSSSTDTQYPSAKCVYDIVGDIEALINAL